MGLFVIVKTKSCRCIGEKENNFSKTVLVNDDGVCHLAVITDSSIYEMFCITMNKRRFAWKRFIKGS